LEKIALKDYQIANKIFASNLLFLKNQLTLL